APWCAPCRAVIPAIAESYRQMQDKGLEVIGYTRLYGSYRDDQQNAGEVPPEKEISLTKEFVKRFKIGYPVAIAEKQDVFEKYHIRGIPTMIFIDKKGRIADFKIGSGNPALIQEKIESMLQEKPAA
ncbi:MAG: TlpA disulfide reductase family protein, partial [Calditrichia bacterium]